MPFTNPTINGFVDTTANPTVAIATKNPNNPSKTVRIRNFENPVNCVFAMIYKVLSKIIHLRYTFFLNLYL